MRLILAMVLVAGCTTSPCGPCSGCCDSSGACRSGFENAFCGRNEQACSKCFGADVCAAQVCGPAPIVVRDAGMDAGTRVDAGTGDAGTPDAGPTTTSVTLHYRWSLCCSAASCDCIDCAPQACDITRSLTAAQLSAAAVDLAQCSITPGDIDCTFNCPMTAACGAPPHYTCSAFAGIQLNACDWQP